MDRIIYFDNASTTKPSQAVVAKLNDVLVNVYGNASSLHGLGISAENEIRGSAKVVSELCGCGVNEVFFNSGGTEGNNQAIFGTCNAQLARGRHIITTFGEHASVEQPIKRLEEQGFCVTRLGLGANGCINLQELESSMRQDTILVSIIHVNNEIGSINDIMSASKIVKDKNKMTLFHSDGVQAFAKIPVNLENIDLYTISAHKIHGLKGVGAIIRKKGARILPLMYGGGQQSNFRPGTENIPGIAVLGVAAKEYAVNRENLHVRKLKSRLKEITTQLSDVFINGDAENGSDYILNLSFLGVRGEALLHSLECDGIYVSTGAACNSRKKRSALEFQNFGLSRERAESAIRFSFSNFNTEEEVEICIEALKKYVPALRSHVRKRKK